MKRLIFLIVVLYIVFTQYIINGYDNINNDLQKTIDNLIQSCNTSNNPPEKNKYL